MDIKMREELRKLRVDCLQIAHAGGDGNLQSTFSSLEIIWTLYHKIMHWSKELRQDSNRDYFILSKGQSNLALLAVMEELGLFERKELDTFCKFGSRFSMQADRSKFDGGIETSAGSLGHGFPMAVGIAMACKILGSTSRIYVLAGDGEMNEGTMWEACILAKAKKLDNLCLIIDDNRSIGKMIELSGLKEKLESFGFSVSEADGHEPEQLTLEILKKEQARPTAIIAHTVRGFGSETLMNDNSWFHRAPNSEELSTLIQEVKAFEKTNDFFGQ